MPNENTSINENIDRDAGFQKAIEERLRLIQERIHYRSFILGVLAILSLLAIGTYIQHDPDSSFMGQYYTPVFSTIFIGLATGHYIGLAFTTAADNLTSAYIGAFVTLTLLSFTVTTFSPLSFALVGIATAVYLAHDTEIVEENSRIELAIELFAGQVARLGVFLIALLEYVVPFTNTLDVAGFLGIDSGTAILGVFCLTIFFMATTAQQMEKANKYKKQVDKINQKI